MVIFWFDFLVSPAAKVQKLVFSCPQFFNRQKQLRRTLNFVDDNWFFLFANKSNGVEIDRGQCVHLIARHIAHPHSDIENGVKYFLWKAPDPGLRKNHTIVNTPFACIYS